MDSTNESKKDTRSSPNIHSSVPVREPEKIVEKHEHIKGRGFISSLALGLSDGVISNVAFLAGFAGAIGAMNVIRLAGVAAMLAGAVAMFFGGFSAARSEHDLFLADYRRELGEIEEEPQEERQELKNFYIGKGLSQEESEIVVRRITSNKQKWLEDLLMHEVHVHEEELEHPFKVAGVVGLSFLLGAFVPLIPYLLFTNRYYSIITSVVVSLIFLFIAGAWKGRLSGRSYWRAGLELLLIGAAASGLLYLIGSLLVFA
jgi:vacuolar iron transporter family protein